MDTIDPVENRRLMLAGELYYAFAPDLSEDRLRCKRAITAYSAATTAGNVSRRRIVELLNHLLQDPNPLPPPAPTEREDSRLLVDYPHVDGPIKMDYGFNVKLGKGVYVNSNSTWIDTCTITIGARTLIGPNCSFYSGTHPTDPFLRNGVRGPELGKPIVVGEDCWFGGSCVVLPGVTIGRGVTIGAGSVVTKDVPDFVVVVGNPARIVKRLDVAEKLKNEQEGGQ
ncbi:maltose O-acetyltransferase [Rhypophila sp. PSN 637]